MNAITSVARLHGCTCRRRSDLSLPTHLEEASEVVVELAAAVLFDGAVRFGGVVEGVEP